MENQQGFVMPGEPAEGIVIEPSTGNNLEDIFASDSNNLGTHGDDSAGTSGMQDIEQMNNAFQGIFDPNDLPNNHLGGAPHQPIHNSGFAPYQPMNNFGSDPHQPIHNSGIAPHHQPMNNFGSAPPQPINNSGFAPYQPMNSFGSAPNQPLNNSGIAPHHQPMNSSGSAPYQPIYNFGSASHQPVNNFVSDQPNNNFEIAPHEPDNNFGVVPYQPINNRPAVIVPEAQLQPRHLAEERPHLLNAQQLQLHPPFRCPSRRQRRALHRDKRPYPYAPRGTGIPPFLYDHSFQEAGIPVDPHVREFIATGLSESYEVRRRIDASPNDMELRRVVEILNRSLDSN